MRTTIITTFLLWASLAGFATTEPTKQWTLEECIRYALEHNIDLKQREVEHQAREVELHTSKFNWLPDLNASVGQNFDFGRSPSRTGVIADQNSSNTSASVSLTMPIFDGLRTPSDIAAKRLNLRAAVENLNRAKEDLSIQIAGYYLQALYNKELLRIAELQLAYSEEQVVKTEAMVNAGKVPLSQLYDIKAQAANDEVSRTEAENNVRLALLDLAQSLEMERSGEAFDVQTPDTLDAVQQYLGSILPPDDIYAHAVAFKPQIKEQEYLLESQKKQLKVARSYYFPQLSFGASYSNGYYHYYTGDIDSPSFADQLNQNGRKTIGFSLTIPLFNRFQTRNNVRTAKLNIHNQELLMENTKKALYKEIQQAYYNATAAQSKYRATGRSVEATRTAFQYARKTNYAKSLAEEAQAKYEFILRTKILDFYNGTPLRL